MARKRSEEKRQIILEATAVLIAEDGVVTPTSKIAKAAGVAEGSIFQYFNSKDELLNQLYLDLKSKLSSSYVDIVPTNDLKESLWEFWFAYVSWGISNPIYRQALVKLSASGNIDNNTREAAAQNFKKVRGLLIDAQSLGPLRNQPYTFVGSLMVAMAETAIDFIGANPELRESICADSFTAFWNAVTKE